MDTDNKPLPLKSVPEQAEAERGRFTRRDFLVNSAALPPLIAALFAAPVVISCGDGGSDSSSSDGGGGSGDGGSNGTDIEGDVGPPNHFHEVVLTAAQQEDGSAVTLTLEGAHQHSLDLTADQVASIAAGDTVTQRSYDSTGSTHEHDVTFN